MLKQAITSTLLMLMLAGCSHAPHTTGGAAAGGGVGDTTSGTTSYTKPVSFSILHDYVKGEDLNQIALDFKLMKELGITIWRGSFAWGDLEPSRGKYDLAWLKQFVALAGREGMKLRPYLGYTPQWAAKGGSDDQVWNDPPARMQDWSAFVSTVATALKPYKHILSYEIYNEENVPQWWDGTPGEYNEVLRRAASAIRGTSSSQRVILGGMVWPDEKWVHAACVTYKNARNFDIIPIHAYPETWTPPDQVLENYLDQHYPGHFRYDFVSTVDSYCGRKPIWINEMGYANTPGRTEKDQANWWARAFASFLSEPRVEHLGVYQIKERVKGSTVIGGEENYYLGITRPDRSKKLAFYTIQRLVALLDAGTLTIADSEIKTEVTAGRRGEYYQHLFVRPDGRQVLFVWDKQESPTVRISVRKGSQAWEYGLDGRASRYGRFDGRTLEGVSLNRGTVRIFEIRP